MAKKFLVGSTGRPYIQDGLLWLYDSATAAWPTTVGMTHDCTVANPPYYTSVAQLSAGAVTPLSHSGGNVLANKSLYRYVGYSGQVAGCSIEMWVEISTARGLYWHLQFGGHDSAAAMTRDFAKRITRTDATPWGTTTEVISTVNIYGGYTAPSYITLTA